MSTLKFISLIIIVVFFNHCAPVNFYSDQGLSKRTGLKFYTVKPYLQVESENETGRIIKLTPVFLPDISNPQYLAVKNRPGSAKVDIKLSDGVITTFGFESEEVLPETIESLAKLVSESAGAIEDLNSLKGLPGLKASATSIKFYEVVMKDGKTSLVEVSPDK